MVLQFVQHAKTTKAEGVVVVSENGTAANIRLEDGDIIFIPRKTDVIAIGGEVVVPQSVVYMQGAVLGDYLSKAGGLTERADAKRIIIIKPNGSVYTNANISIRAGDQIMVMPKVDTKNMQFTKDITQIIYQIAVAAKIAGNI
jgi:protein involved in polysaccharide export with SLBB domain